MGRYSEPDFLDGACSIFDMISFENSSCPKELKSNRSENLPSFIVLNMMVFSSVLGKYRDDKAI